MTSTPAAPPAAVTHSNTRLQELKPPRTFWSVVQPTIDSGHVWDTRWRNMIRRDQRLLGTYRQVAASQNPPALGSVTRSGLETLIWFRFCSPDSHLSFRSSRADSYQPPPPNRNLRISDEETPPNVTEDLWRSSNQSNAKGLSLKERWIRSVTAPPRSAFTSG